LLVLVMFPVAKPPAARLPAARPPADVCAIRWLNMAGDIIP